MNITTHKILFLHLKLFMVSYNIIMADKNTSIFSFVQFIEFLKKNNVFSAIIAAVFAKHLNEILKTVLNGVIKPIMNIDRDGDGVRDIKKIEDFEISIKGMKFKVGKIIVALIEFAIVMYLIYLITRMANGFFGRPK